MTRRIAICGVATSCVIGAALVGLAPAALGFTVASAAVTPTATATGPHTGVSTTTVPEPSGVPAGTPTPAPSAPTTSTSGPPSTSPHVADPVPPVPPRPAVATAHVSIVDFGFSPATITVTAGTTVIWTDTGASIHSVTSDSGAFDSSPTCPTGPCINPGSSFSHLFAQAGQFGYHCRVHSFMTGTVIVTAAPPTTTSTTAAGVTSTTAANSPISAGGAANPSTSSPSSTGPQLAFTGASSNEAWIAFGALFTITVGFALRPRRRAFPIPVPDDSNTTHHRN
jgi:plastocyanin